MTGQDAEAMRKLNSESCMEREEQRQEKEFLEGNPGKKQPARKAQ